VAPDGTPDPSVFSTEANRKGIQVGTAVALLVKHGGTTPCEVRYRDLWGTAKRETLLASLDASVCESQYIASAPTRENRYALRHGKTSGEYGSWPRLTDIAARRAIPGLLEMRRETLLSTDRDALLLIRPSLS
jgi:hypothetical protein